jgi:hypothetical protein
VYRFKISIQDEYGIVHTNTILRIIAPDGSVGLGNHFFIFKNRNCSGCGPKLPNF